MDDQNTTPEAEELKKCTICGTEMTPAYEYGMCFWECTECGNWEDWE